METELETITTMNSNSHTLTRGNKQFELCNHLGNVLVTVQDRKRSVDVNVDNQADYYLPYLRTVTNYYAYGSAMPGIGGSIKECIVTSSNLSVKKYPYFHTFSNDSTSGFTAGSGARSVTNPTHNVLHLESIWTTRPLANKSIYLKNGVNYALKFNLAGFSVVSGYTHTVKVRILLPGNTLSYTYAATGNQTINFTSNTTGNVTVEISSQITGSGTYSINPYIDIDNFSLSWDSAYTAYVNTCGSNPENYKYGFNTQEKDNEIAGENNIYTAEYWEYDARVARRWNVDPVFKAYESPFSCFGNNPICFVDINGDDTFNVISSAINTNGEDLKLKGGTGMLLFKVFTNDANKTTMNFDDFTKKYQISAKNVSHKINGVEQALTYAEVLFVNSTDPNFNKAINVTNLTDLNKEYYRLKGLVGSKINKVEKVKYFRQGATGDYKFNKKLYTYVDGVGLFQSADIGNYIYGMIVATSGGTRDEAMRDGDFLQFRFYVRKSFNYTLSIYNLFFSSSSKLTFENGNSISQVDDCIDGYYLYAGGDVGVYIDAFDLLHVKNRFLFNKSTTYSQFITTDFRGSGSTIVQSSVSSTYKIKKK